MTATLDPYEIVTRTDRLEKTPLRSVYVLSWFEGGAPHGRAFSSEASVKMAARDLQVNCGAPYTIHHLAVES